MASTLTPTKSIVAAFGPAQVSTATVTAGSTLVTTEDWEGELAVKLGRTTTVSITGAVEMALERSSRAAANDFWTPVIPFTTANHGTAASAQPLASGAAAGAVAINLSATTGFTVADKILFIWDANTPSLSEWCEHIVSVTSPHVTVFDPLTRAHTAATCVGSDQAEEWNIPVSLSSGSKYRFTVNTAKNGVTSPVVIEAVLSKMVNILAS